MDSANLLSVYAKGTGPCAMTG